MLGIPAYGDRRREWDEGVLRSCLYPHDVEAVLKICPMQWGEENRVAWFYEKSGIFTVKSAYRLALNSDHIQHHEGGSSSEHSDGRALYREIWRTAVPPKVPIFAWKLERDCLATQCKMRNRALVCSTTCTICGVDAEMGHRALIRCTKAVALRREMQKVWRLLEESKIHYIGSD
jgi:hypothetical protein